jgi:hypothetical protein
MHGLPLSVNLKIRPKAPADNNARISFWGRRPRRQDRGRSHAQRQGRGRTLQLVKLLFGFNIKFPATRTAQSDLRQSGRVSEFADEFPALALLIYERSYN